MGQSNIKLALAFSIESDAHYSVETFSNLFWNDY